VNPVSPLLPAIALALIAIPSAQAPQANSQSTREGVTYPSGPGILAAITPVRDPFANIAPITTATSITSASLTPTSMTFFCVARLVGGGCTPAQTATLKNTGKSVLNITSEPISGQYFSHVVHCGKTLLPGKSCTITVSFHGPASRSQVIRKTYKGSLRIFANATGSPKSVSLIGITSGVP
jgi:hypothetical protein